MIGAAARRNILGALAEELLTVIIIIQGILYSSAGPGVRLRARAPECWYLVVVEICCCNSARIHIYAVIQYGVYMQR